MSTGCFADQPAVVVGAAAGIGKATATLLAHRGARVACLDRDVDGARRLAASLGDQGSKAVAVEMDVTDDASVAEALASAERDLGPISVLVNCAGITGATNRLSEDVDVDDFDLVYRVNLRGAFLLSRAVLPRMVAHGYGRVLHVASIAGKEGNAGMVAYSATKAGLIGMVKAQGKEYAGTGVTVNALAPAVIRTAMVDAMPEAQVRYMTDRIPMKRTGTLAEAAELICWVVSPACSFTTGFTFDMSGGRAVY
ncbi:SDR family NAD(P)-dependent oxidoreductase [Planosporangium mesophilum]|uniref:3-oxoacyl-ACP reductase n=1 Tax=Planosporangium mesophilum TaxID=689768 RepID=A0A8J3TC50_9ACTN|nr:SDR family NAD(P)-dependent oxidoreductase [Planosporangium mesophilum]NJC84000.1 SDR family oxidoreductase [Planosporangium mesophilum]GII22631.1 3-oxoacyl-ACP reductase [Planosporangium mesophilum]